MRLRTLKRSGVPTKCCRKSQEKSIFEIADVVCRGIRVVFLEFEPKDAKKAHEA